MTSTTTERPAAEVTSGEEEKSSPDTPVGKSGNAAPRPLPPFTPRRIGIAVATWAVVTSVSVVLVLYGVGPMLEQRDQGALLSDYRREVREASRAEFTVDGIVVPTRAPEVGSPVAILDIAELKVEQVVVEGVGPQQTRRGPAHVPGTAGPGQPGNSAIVGRRSAFGGAFRNIDQLQPGDEILVTTTQGQSVYEVAEVRTARVGPGVATTPASTTTTVPPADESGTTSEDDTDLLTSGGLTTDDLYGPTPDDRLTLVTSASVAPWATDEATVVVAALRDRPFEPTPQGGRIEDQDGRSADDNAWAPLALAAVAYLVAAATAVVLYRRARPRSAYLLTAPPLLAATILVAEAVARTLPAWF